jgi:hypothetical protein
MPTLTRTQVRALAVTALQSVSGLATVRDGALRIAAETSPLAFIVSAGNDQTNATFGRADLTYGFDVFVYVASVLGQEATTEATLDSIIAGSRDALKTAGFRLGASRIVPGQGGTALHQIGDKFYRVERQPCTYEQQVDDDED